MREFFITSAACLMLTSAALGQAFNDFDQPPHNYWTADLTDPMTRLLQRIESGEAEPLDGLKGQQLLNRLLKELDIPVESQVMVWSRTSLQKDAVSRENPRAMYFNEDTYLGFIPGARIEIASTDPKLGSVFYFERPLNQTEGAMFTRARNCIGCHAGSATNFLPGLLGRSVYQDENERRIGSINTFERVGHEVALHDRWGGWYVTGGHPELRHMGNAVAFRGKGGAYLERDKWNNMKTLEEFFDVKKYPLPTSDMVALLVLDHQISMEFELMEAHYRYRQGLADGFKSFDRNMDKVAATVVDYLLFKTEAELAGKKIEGDEAFRRVFLSRATTDDKGRSLRDLNLSDRIFEHRCSFMIHSPAFLGLPQGLKEKIYKRLVEVLEPADPAEGYAYFAPGERKAILEILQATVDGFPGHAVSASSE